jgi:hypothetical protein
LLLAAALSVEQMEDFIKNKLAQISTLSTYRVQKLPADTYDADFFVSWLAKQLPRLMSELVVNSYSNDQSCFVFSNWESYLAYQNKIAEIASSIVGNMEEYGKYIGKQDSLFNAQTLQRV